METFYLASLQLHNFKSYEQASFHFTEGFQVLTGCNGMGKTNVLDAVFYLGLCRSSFSLRDSELVRKGADFFRLEAELKDISGRNSLLVAKVQPGRQKVFEWDQKPCETLADHIGKVPVVLICPNDHSLITGFSEERRRFFDQTLCQVDSTYLQALLRYNRLLQQRNAWLKQVLAGKIAHQPVLLESFDVQMESSASIIQTQRQQFIEFLKTRTVEIYHSLAGGEETPALSYLTLPVGKSWMEVQREAREADMRLGRSTEGLHRDDILLDVNDLAARKYASQGQIKSLVIALRLAQYQFIAEQKGVCPLLLLDDLFDKLDNQRVEALLGYLVNTAPTQVFITDTENDRVAGVLDKLHAPYRTFMLEDSRILHTCQSQATHEKAQ